ncbi:MAG: hypothetical protein HY738_11475 [Bacteroidia bacterium]|nr:hypothetical protein [Bacteroidia bacterium]
MKIKLSPKMMEKFEKDEMLLVKGGVTTSSPYTDTYNGVCFGTCNIYCPKTPTK